MRDKEGDSTRTWRRYIERKNKEGWAWGKGERERTGGGQGNEQAASRTAVK